MIKHWITYSLLLVVLCSSPLLSGKTLNVGIKSEFDKFYPFDQKIGDKSFIRNFVLPPVVAIDQNEDWTCVVCEILPTQANGLVELEVTGEGSSKKTVMRTQWKISEKYYWNDGRPVTAYDVKFTLGHALLGSPLQKEVQIKVDTKNPRRFEIVFGRVRADYYQVLALSLVPHKKAKLIAEGKQSSRENEVLRFASGMYYGPYFVDQITSNLILLRANSYYSGLKNDFSQIKIHRLQLLETTIKMMKEGKIDMIADGSLNHRQIQRILKEPELKSQWRFHHSPSDEVDTILINLKNPYLADQNLRQAIFLTLDRGSLLADIFNNYGSIAAVPPYFTNSANLKADSYDIAEARRLLDSSGWELQGKARVKNGVRLDFNLVYLKSTTKNRIASRLRSQLAAVGINLNLVAYSSQKAFVNDTLRKGFYRDLALVTTRAFPGLKLRSLYHSAAIPQKTNDYRGMNLSFWQNRRIDRLLDELEVEIDPSKRAIRYSQFNRLFSENIPNIPLLTRPRFTVLHNKLVNFRFPGHSYHLSLFSSGWTSKDEPRDVF